jgi:hypothetical protein
MTDAPTDAPTDTPATIEATDATEAPAEAPPVRRAALVLAVSIAVVLLITSIGLAVVAARHDSTDGREKALRTAASEVGTAFLTYDYKDPQAHKDSVLALATGSFRTEYQKAFDQGLGELITKVKATSKGFVKDVYVSEIDADQAQTIVVADVTRNGAGGERTLYDIYMLLTFVDVKGHWKVDQVTDLNFAQAGAAAGATTSTSIPVP